MTQDATLTRLESVLDRLERLGGFDLDAAPAAVLPNGFPGPVAAGELIESAWGNATNTSFANINNRLTRTFAMSNSSGTSGGVLPILDYTVPAQPVAGQLLVWSYVRCDMGGGSAYEIWLEFGSTVGSKYTFGTFTGTHMVVIVGRAATVAGTPLRVRVTGTGTATITTFPDVTVNRTECLWFGNPL